MVAEIGLEPTTCRVWTGCSSQLSYSATKIKKNGGAKGDRTPDPLRARQVLSQLSYDPTNNGRNDRIWTCNPLVPNQMHCQVVLHSVHKCLNIIPNGSKYFNTFFHFFKVFFLEVPVGLEPAIIELQSIALPTWLRNQRFHIVSHIFGVYNTRYNIFLSFPNIEGLIYSNNMY